MNSEAFMNKNKFLFPADVLLPLKDFDKWAVIACDQYTSEPEYWKKAEEYVGDSKSALNIVLPEVYLSDDDGEKIEKINFNMQNYLSDNTFCEYKDSYIYVERTQSDGKIRRGLVGLIDLEDYDYTKGTNALTRATEATVLERIPPRVKIRENAPLELPHVMLLIDDCENKLLGEFEKNTQNLKKVYDFCLMMNGGHIKGWQVQDDERINDVLSELKEKSNGLLFCVGDGNHSLATAKQCYINNPNEYNRYALVEVVNIHDDALGFEPIYRAVFSKNPKQIISDFVAWCGGEYSGADAQKFTCIVGKEKFDVSLKPKAWLPVETLQVFLDEYMQTHQDVKIDYIHGVESLTKIADRENCLGFLFEGIAKDTLFEAVRQGGSLPRKTFSMGHADDKRFYLESRKIK